MDDETPADKLKEVLFEENQKHLLETEEMISVQVCTICIYNQRKWVFDDETVKNQRKERENTIMTAVRQFPVKWVSDLEGVK